MKSLNSALLPVLLIASASLGACSTIVKGDNQTVSILSNVKGADVYVNGEMIGQTPYTGPVERAADTTVTLKKTGYETKTVTLNTTFEPVFWGNIIFGGFIGSTTDMASGSMYKYAPATVTLDLDKVAEGK